MAAQPLAVLLLPAALEELDLRAHAEALLRAPGVVAIEPGRASYASYLRFPPRRVARMARGQARRLTSRLPGRVAVVVIFDALQWPLAEQLVARSPGAELWLGRPEGDEEPAGGRLGELRAQAAEAAAFTFTASGPVAEVNAPLRERLEALGVRTR